MLRGRGRTLWETRLGVHHQKRQSKCESNDPATADAVQATAVHPQALGAGRHLLEKRFDVRPPSLGDAEARRRRCKKGAGNVEWLMPPCSPIVHRSGIALRWWDWFFPRSVLALDAQPRVTRVITSSILVTASLTAVTFSLGWSRDVHDTWENWRSDRLVNEAEGYFGNGDYGSGFARANKAYLECPQNVDAIRCLARRCEEVGAAESLYFFDRLERMEKMTVEDFTSKVSALIRRNRWKEAQALASALLGLGHDSERLVELGCALDCAGFSMPQLLRKKAEERLMAAQAPKECLAIAILWMNSGAADQRAKATACLWKLAESGNGLMARKATAALHEHLGPGDPASRYLAWLMTEQPGADAAQHLRALSRLIGAMPESADRLLTGTVSVWRNESLEERTMLGRLIFACARPQLLTGLFTRADAVKGPHVAELYVAGLMGAGRLEECMALLKDRELLVTRAQRSFAEATLAIRGRCKPEEARHRLLCALGAASAEANPGLLTGVAELAARQGLPTIAAQAYEECQTIHGSESVAYDGLIALYDATGETEKLRETIARGLAMWPGNERYLEMSVYINLLMGADMERSFACAQQLHAARPADDMRLFLLTLAHARLGNTVGAQAELRRLFSKGGIPLRYLAVIGGLLKGSGDSITAVKAVSGIYDTDVTLPEEKAFLALARL